MTVALWIAIGILVVAAALAVARAVRPGLLGDRAVALDTIAAIITCGFLVLAAITGDGLFLEISLVIGLLGFLAAVSAARFVERRDV